MATKKAGSAAQAETQEDHFEKALEEDVRMRGTGAEFAPVVLPTHRTTVPKAPQIPGTDPQGQSIVNRIRATVEAAVFSRDPNAAASALVVLGHQVLPPTTRPDVRLYLAEVGDYLKGKAAP